MKTIYKYTIFLSEDEASYMMRGKILSVGVQKAFPDQVCVWAEYDPSVEPTDVKLYAVGTGHPIGDNDVYVGSTVDEPFVWHVYQKA